jgi:Ca2+-transporting ATPase
MNDSAAAAGVPEWHLVSVEDALRSLESDAHAGLTEAEAAARLRVHGPNAIREGRRRGPARMLLDQLTDFMILVLLAAALISGLIGDLTDTVVILVIVLLNAIIGFAQEYRAERAVAALRALAAPSARVLRGGERRTIAAADLVPGDIVLLEAGNAVAADLRLLDAAQLRIEEAALTGESQPVEKHTRALAEAQLALGDRRNMAYKGTLIVGGRGFGVVVATGMDTELGRIARLLQQEEEVKTPLQKRLVRFGRVLSIAVLVICAILFVTGWLRGEPLLLMALTAISLAVAAIPEALPAVVTVSLAVGARRMVGKQALIRKLPAVETLGSVTYICSDKTGTLTLNRMRVEETWVDGRLMRSAEGGVRSGEPDFHSALRTPHSALFTALALSNDAHADKDGKVFGDPTEVALFEAARQAGFDKQSLIALAPRVAEIPFDSERARMTTIHRGGGEVPSLAPDTPPPPPPSFPPPEGEGSEPSTHGVIAFIKGAPETLLPLCRDALGADGLAAFDHAQIAQVVERMAADGLRVLAFALRRLPEVPKELTADAVESDLSFIGLVGLLDPPRPEAGEAVALCVAAGITPVMITGDHPATARTIARQLRIGDDELEVMTGAELAQLPLADFERRVERVRVYARVAPEQKIKIVKALQDRGEFVAMTGDGVNDAPALRRADIGVAMGCGGTDVAREAAHMVLLDDNFATIVAAVREGRRIFDNIRKFIKYTMTSNSGEIWTIFLAPFLGLPIPLLPIHILWINLVTDGLPGLALAAEPEERGIMRRAPRPPNESIFAHGMWQHIIWVGLLMGGVSLLTQAFALYERWGHWQTMVFTVLTLSQLGHALAIRSERESLFAQGVASNLPLAGTVLLTVALQLAVIYVPFLNPIFRTAPLSAGELVLCLALSCVVFAAVEIEKLLVRRGLLYRP